VTLNDVTIDTMPVELALALTRVRAERRFDAARVLDAKCALVEEYFTNNNLAAAVVGVSGGVDSAVVLGLLARVQQRRASTLRRVVAALAPVFVAAGATNQDGALAKGREVAARFGADVVVVDLTSATDATRHAIDRGLGGDGDAWAVGQLVSVMRTPAFYYLAARLQQQGLPSLVVGTTNRDEGSYLGFFGKASDGMVDLQIISDLHKSEVYALAALLDVPERVRRAVPAGDVFDGRSDVQMIGAPYDFVELYTGLRAAHVDVAPNGAFVASLVDGDARAAFATWARAIEELHAKNAHKYIVGSPAVHLDVMARAVPGGWSTPQRARRDDAPPAAAFVGGRAVELDRALVAQLAAQLAAARSVEASSAADYGDSVRVLDGVLSDGEAASLARAALAACTAGVAVGVHGRVNEPTAALGVGSRRATAWDEELARALWQRVAPHLPVVRVLDERTPTDDFGSRVWRPVGLNPLFRFMTYEEGGSLVEHEDAGYVYPDGERATLMSVVLVLAADGSDREGTRRGGATRLLRDPERHLPVHARRHDDDERVGRAHDVLFAHAPRAGSALILDHRIRHDGEPWRGPGHKIIVRTDVAFERCGAPRPRAATTTPGRDEGDDTFTRKAARDPIYGPLWQRFRDAKVLEEAGFFDDGAPLHADDDARGAGGARGAPSWLVTPLHKLAPPGDDDAPLAVLVCTGGFCPVHRGHEEMMEEAKRALTARGVRVLGGYLAPDHDQYVRLKVGDDAPSSEHRLHLCERAVADSDWLMIDPWPAMHAERSLNFSTVITRLERYLSAHVRCARPVRVYYVFGGDNARFSLALAHSGTAGVCVNRSGHEQTLARYRDDPRVREARGARDVVFAAGARTTVVASRDVRAGDDAALAAPVRDVWRAWRAEKTAVSRALVYVRDEGAWSTAPWREGRDATALAAAWARFVSQLHAALQRAFVDARGPDQRHQIRVQPLHLDEQRARAAAAIAKAGGRVISLDPCVAGTVDVGLSRCFPLCDQSGPPRIGERPGWPPLAQQLASVSEGAWTLLDDDVVTGRTIARVRAAMPVGATISDVECLCDASRAPDAEAVDLVDLVDARDFLCGAREGGLVVVMPHGAVARAPYLLPYVRPAHRVSAPLSSERSFSLEVWRANVELFAAVQPALRLRDANAALRTLMHYVGFDDDDTLEDIARWHVARLD
jgi:NAD+ synthetase